MLSTATPDSLAEQPVSVQEPGLPLRRDEVVSTGFVLQTLLVMVLLLAGLAMVLKWMTKRNPSRWLAKSAKRIVVVDSSRISGRTNVVLLEVDGKKAVVIESPQGASLQFLQHDSSSFDSAIASRSKQDEGQS